MAFGALRRGRRSHETGRPAQIRDPGGRVAIWAWGAKTGNHTFMLVGIGFVIVAFALRLIPRSRDGDGP